MGGHPNKNSFSPSISADGRFVAFTSYAPNLVPGDTNGDFDVFVHDRQTGRTTQVSVDMAGGDHSISPSISADGRFVAFASGGSDIVKGDVNRKTDIFVQDRGLGLGSDISHLDLADVTGDGRADLVWRNMSLSKKGATFVWQMTAEALRGPVTFAGDVPGNWVLPGGGGRDW